MTIAALTWPEAVVGSISVATLGLVLAVLVWSIFRTGQAAIRSDGGQRRLVEELRAEVAEMRAELQRRDTAPPSHSSPESP